MLTTLLGADLVLYLLWLYTLLIKNYGGYYEQHGNVNSPCQNQYCINKYTDRQTNRQTRKVYIVYRYIK